MPTAKKKVKLSTCRRCGGPDANRPGTLCRHCFKAIAQGLKQEEGSRAKPEESSFAVQERIEALLAEVGVAAGMTGAEQKARADAEAQREMCLRLAERVYLQSELLSRRAGRDTGRAG
jgi:predicted amidophosphoribosyltransferase